MKKAINNKNLEWFKKFVTICDDNYIPYFITNGTLLGCIRDKGPIPWDDDFDVMMAPRAYAKLKRLFPNNCIDGINTEDYPLVIPKFIPNKNNYLKNNIFVDIFIVVPTNDKKVRHFRSIRQKFNFSLQTIHSSWEPYAWYIHLYKFLTKPFKFMVKKMTYKQAIEILATKNYDYFFTIDNPIDAKKINIIPILSKNVIKKTFADFLVNVPKEYEQILKYKYNDYLIPRPEQRPFIHINTISIQKYNPKKLKRSQSRTNYSSNSQNNKNNT